MSIVNRFRLNRNPDNPLGRNKRFVEFEINWNDWLDDAEEDSKAPPKAIPI